MTSVNILVAGSVTAKQYSWFRSEYNKAGLSPKIVRLSSLKWFLFQDGVIEHAQLMTHDDIDDWSDLRGMNERDKQIYMEAIGDCASDHITPNMVKLQFQDFTGLKISTIAGIIIGNDCHTESTVLDALASALPARLSVSCPQVIMHLSGRGYFGLNYELVRAE
jgi:hypothetical protein